MNDKYYNNIKCYLINNETTRLVKDYSKNKSDLTTYYEVGKELVLAGNQYGEGIIKEYSKKLTNELGKGYSQRNLRNMRQFYKVSSNLKWQTMSAKLSWSHYCEIIWLNIYEINYYLKISIDQNLSIRQLRQKIKSKEYERLDDKTKSKLITQEDPNLVDFVKNPILIKNSHNYTKISEKILQKLILEDIELFMKELGNYFCFIGSEYKIKVDNRYNYIDLLLFNIEFNCYVVVELKITELKKEHIGQLQFYMNYIDNNLRSFNQDKTIGIIICKKENKYVIEYCSDDRIIAREYELI